MQFIRDGLVSEGWKYHEDLPLDWMYKLYNHKIEGIETIILITLSPDGTKFKSKKMIMKKYNEGELSLDADDLVKIMNFKPDGYQEQKTVEDPDESWFHDPTRVPEAWKMRKYLYNNLKTSKVEEVFHYLTPDKTVLRGRKHVYNYMLDTETFNHEDFNKFHFSKNNPPQPKVRQKVKDNTKTSDATYEKENKNRKVGNNNSRTISVLWEEGKQDGWGPWNRAKDMPEGWTVRYGGSEVDRKCEYKSPDQQVFPGRVSAIRFLKRSGVQIRETWANKRLIEARLTGSWRTKWGEWVTSEDLPFLPGWSFSIGHRRGERRMKYRDTDGRVFKSRGSLIRQLHSYKLRTKSQLEVLKKLLKVNQTMHFEELRKNDKFIKHVEVDANYLVFLKARYYNHSVPEVEEPGLPNQWRKKVIHGVDYFRDPTGQYVFNSRRLVVDFLRKTRFDLSDEDLVAILEESEDESDLSESEDDTEEEEDIKLVEENGDKEVSGAEEHTIDEGVESQVFVEC